MSQLTSITHNVHEHCGRAVERVQGDIDRNIYDFFFHHVIAYTHGSRKAIINFFFQRFYEECQQLGIQKVWDEDNGQKLVVILNRLNFREQQPVKVSKTKKQIKPMKHGIVQEFIS